MKSRGIQLFSFEKNKWVTKTEHDTQRSRVGDGGSVFGPKMDKFASQLCKLLSHSRQNQLPEKNYGVTNHPRVGKVATNHAIN